MTQPASICKTFVFQNKQRDKTHQHLSCLPSVFRVGWYLQWAISDPTDDASAVAAGPSSDARLVACKTLISLIYPRGCRRGIAAITASLLFSCCFKKSPGQSFGSICPAWQKVGSYCGCRRRASGGPLTRERKYRGVQGASPRHGCGATPDGGWGEDRLIFAFHIRARADAIIEFTAAASIGI